MRGHHERLDALIVPIPTPFATLVLSSMLVAENLCYWFRVTKSYLSNGLLVVPLPNFFE